MMLQVTPASKSLHRAHDRIGHDFINQLCAEEEDRAGTLMAVATKRANLSARSCSSDAWPGFMLFLQRLPSSNMSSSN